MLNPMLYAKLCTLYGEVRVSKSDDKGVPPTLYKDPISGRIISRWPQGVNKGEEYQVCCPFCNDQHFHLYINHRYGEEYRGGGYCRIAKCFKGCLDYQENRERLWNDIMFSVGKKIDRDTLRRINQMPVRESKPLEVSMPLGTVPLANLGDKHPAVQYMYSRGFGRETFKPYSLSYCAKSNDFMISERIIIPIKYKGEIVAWQSRKIYEETRGPKYFSAPGAHLGSLLYNYDVACEQPYVVLTEGAADVWRAGPASVCLFGKSLSDGQKSLIVDTWYDKPVLVMLDSDAQSEINNIVDVLHRLHGRKVAPIMIPEEFKDPGNTPSDVLNDLIMEGLWKVKRL